MEKEKKNRMWVCPFCGSVNTEWSDPEKIDNSLIRFETACNECGEIWYEDFRYEGYVSWETDEAGNVIDYICDTNGDEIALGV